MAEYTKALDKDEWSKHYNLNLLNQVKDLVTTGNVQVWARAL